MNSKCKKSTAILLCFLQFVEGHIQQKCINCQDFNRLSERNCPERIAECGDCLTGFVRDKNDPRICYEIESVEVGGGGEVIGIEGQSTELPCKFSAEVDCFWKKNGHKVLVEESTRFRFKTKVKDKLSKDCTLVIDYFSPSDVDDWRCCTDHVKSESIQVQMAKPLKLLVQPKPAMEVNYGEAVILPCVFNQPVQCDWSFKSKLTLDLKAIKMNGNYEYMDEAISLKTDCSLRIREISAEEEGEWRCKGLIPHTKLTEESSSITLTGNHRKMLSKNVIIITLNDVIKTGKKVRYEALMSENEPLVCEVSKVAKTLEWVLLGETVKRQPEVNYLTLSGEEISNNLEDWSSVTLRCIATYEDESRMTSHITILNTDMKNVLGEAEVKEEKLITMVIIGLLVLIFAVLALFAIVLVHQHKKNNISSESIA